MLDILRQAHDLGTSYGQSMITPTTEEGIIDYAQSLLQRGKDLVQSVLDRIQSVLSDAVEQAQEDDEDIQDAVQQAISDLTDSLPGNFAGTEVHAEIEQGVSEVLDQANVSQVVWFANPKACKVCQKNADQGPIDRGTQFVSGHTKPPSHPNCRCNLQPSEEE